MACSKAFNRLVFTATIAFAALTCVSATQVMQRPADYMDPPREYTTGDPTPQVVKKRSNDGYVQAAYFTNWGIYGANFQPSNITPSDLTHILYAFADVSPDTGNISLTDTYADEQKHFTGDSWNQPGNNLYGCLKQMYLFKLANRNLKVLLSVGGYTYSQDGHFSFVTDSGLRANFVTSAVSFVENFGFDGIDIDFEYANTPALAEGFADLLTELRAGFDALATKKGDTVPYQITAASPAGYDNYQYFNVPQMDAALTYWNLMAYDYAGSWLNITANQANLYDHQLTNVSTHLALEWYIANGATPSKITMGIPLYGRSFEKTAGIGAAYNGVGPGTLQAGIYSYSDLPLAGATVYENYTDVASYSYDSSSMELVSYDTPSIVTKKAQYVMDNGLAGSMFWELSTDKVGSESLVYTASQVYGTLDQTANHIDYSDSEWTNIANNMGESTTSSSVAPSSTAPTPTSSAASSAAPTTTASSQCSGVGAWSATATYTGGDTATYDGDLWTAKWWTSGDTPGGSAGVWTDDGAC
ncbi:carbohydrate-binding module family 5 protein [Laetiporus sulphureus 93-53]|uniref:Carbohydrate-binding module family 5 protein n=1 Tax=Laetiporus sulphureus 93-53 TaxID=1314785 RepID=A0A165CXC4_9APHY|nr:carbohydrate-binding module family 5 protein [Laetiporus sulphureus 93-53]KZT03657.1 carbohydrate-binding module family 5 protein [Laetiporus sulphureus 93-53]